MGSPSPSPREHRAPARRRALSRRGPQGGHRARAEELNLRLPDFGIPAHWTSHHPFTSAEPLTLEPTESFSRAELDELVDVYEHVIDEAYESPETIAEAPHRASVAQMRFDLVEGTEAPLATARLLREHWSPATTPSD